MGDRCPQDLSYVLRELATSECKESSLVAVEDARVPNAAATGGTYGDFHYPNAE